MSSHIQLECFTCFMCISCVSTGCVTWSAILFSWRLHMYFQHSIIYLVRQIIMFSVYFSFVFFALHILKCNSLWVFCAPKSHNHCTITCPICAHFSELNLSSLILFFNKIPSTKNRLTYFWLLFYGMNVCGCWKRFFHSFFFFLKLSQIIMFGNILMRDDLVSICLFRWIMHGQPDISCSIKMIAGSFVISVNNFLNHFILSMCVFTLMRL